MTSGADAVQAVRRAVETCLDDLPDDARVLVAVSGGADSIALAQAVALSGLQTFDKSEGLQRIA